MLLPDRMLVPAGLLGMLGTTQKPETVPAKILTNNLQSNNRKSEKKKKGMEYW
jgi:hypothetical protein